MITKSKMANMSTNMSTKIFQRQFRLIGTRKRLKTYFQDARIFEFSFMPVHCAAGPRNSYFIYTVVHFAT
jgi:hypothetical protein